MRFGLTAKSSMDVHITSAFLVTSALVDLGLVMLKGSVCWMVESRMGQRLSTAVFKMLQGPRNNKGIIQLKLGGVIYKTPWSKQVLFQNNDHDAFIGFEMFEKPTQNHQSFCVLYEGKEAYIMEWDAGEFFERPKFPERIVNS